MRKTLVIVIAVLFSSCTREVNFKYLMGKWTERVFIPNSEDSINVESYIVFLPNDSVIGIAIWNGDTTHQISGHYKLDTANYTMEYFVRDTSVKLEILRLTNSEMELLNAQSKAVWRYERR